MNQSFRAVVLLILLLLPACFGLFSSNELVNGHDAHSGLVRALYMHEYAGDGQFLVRWASDINFGYGSPMFNFYPPFFYFFSSVLSQVTQNMLLAMNLACVILWAISGIGMYFFAREIWGNKGGILSAVAYMYAPYHIQDLYVRGAFAEFSAFAFFPLILFCILKIHQNLSKRYFILGVLSVFALSLAHNIMSMLFFPLAACYMLFLFLWKRNLPALAAACVILMIGLMMSSFFWLPALSEKKFLNLSFLISMRYDFHKNFIALDQLLRLPFDHSADMQGISFKIGWVSFISALTPLIYVFRNSKHDKNILFHYLFFFLVGFVSIFLTLSYSHVFWENIHLLSFVQFPWRLLAIVSFAISLLSGGIMLMINNETKSNLVLTLMIALVIFSSLKLLGPTNFKEVDQESLKKNISSTIFLGEGEYTPKWIQFPLLSPPPEKFQIIKGNGQISEYRQIHSVEYEAKINAGTPALVCFHSYYFPGWRVLVDGQETQIFSDNKYGVILFLAPAGEHTLRVIFGSTPVRTAGMIISWVGFALFLGGILWFKLIN